VHNDAMRWLRGTPARIDQLLECWQRAQILRAVAVAAAAAVGAVAAAVAATVSNEQ